MGDTRWRTIKEEGLHLKYSPNFLDKRKSDWLLKSLEQDIEYFTGDLTKVKVFGKWHDIPRQQSKAHNANSDINLLGCGRFLPCNSNKQLKVAFGDSGLTYKYSGLSVPARPWPQPLQELRKDIAERVGQDYNFLLVNRYRNGSDYMGEHRDDEAELDKEAGIASISLGAVRDFVLRHGDTRRGKRKVPPVKIPLAHGSCLLMKWPTNKYWYHSLPKRKACNSVRINLTFRKIINT